MSCFDSISIFAAWFSLVGSALLVWPVWRASRILMAAFNLNEMSNDGKGSVFDDGIQATAEAIKEKAGVWTPTSHWLLIVGVGFMVIGGLSSVVAAYCST